MSRYRTQARLDGSETALVVYHGRSFQNATEAFDAADWAAERWVEVLRDAEWHDCYRVINGRRD